MGADGTPPSVPALVTLTIELTAEGHARLEAGAKAAGRTVRQLLGQAIRAELERLEQVARMAAVIGVDLTAPERPALPDGRATTSTFVSPSTGAPALPEVPDLLSSPTETPTP